jgi:hypothetical protein
VSELKKNEALVKLTLLQADLEFEYPQKLEKMRSKADILRLVEEEEAKLKSIAHQKEMEEMQKKVLTYEEYFNANPHSETQSIGESRSYLGDSKKDMKFETYLQLKASAYLFDNDLVDQAYKFWEDTEEKADRLRKIWLDLKRKNALGGIEARTTEEQDGLSEQIVELTRKVRFRID